ncbi:MAG TPA: antibiotic biosynthesis monooxygenase [Acidimicrobiales bacterium]|nr:antibiotic biosynthesis monooxygenase [Acidimicrobiales bacterium]
MEHASSGPVLTVFRSRLRPDAAAHGYDDVAAAMEARARAMPGLLDFKTFTAPDGERLSLIVFDTDEHQAAWRSDPEHREAQRRGREDFYQEYSIWVGRELRHRTFPAGA